MNFVLAHGILGFRERFGVEYFAHITEFLRQLPAKVLVPQVDPTEGISVRGEQLRAQILQGFDRGALDPAQKAHIIAHSMGGLDSRYILSPANKNTTSANDVVPHIASLTTVSTPHRGSPIADLIALKTGAEPAEKNVLNAAGLTEDRAEHMLNRLGISLQGLQDLTTENTRRFNDAFLDNPKVRYFSVAGGGRAQFPHAAALLLPFYLYIEFTTHEANDGLVTVSSAKWGAFDEQLWPTDHADEVGHNLDNLLAFDAAGVLGRYMRIVNTVSAISAGAP